MFIQWVPCGCNSSYSFSPIVFKHCRCFQHGMKMCLCFVFVFYIKCYQSVQTVGTLWAQLLLVFLQLFWNFPDVFGMEWRCACDLGMTRWLFFLKFSAMWTFLFFFTWNAIKCIDSGYLVDASPLTVFHWLFWNFVDVFGIKWSCACSFDMILWIIFSHFFCFVNNLFFLHGMLFTLVNVYVGLPVAT